MALNFFLLLLELLVLGGIVLLLHYVSGRYGLAPLLVFLGGLTGLLQYLVPLGVYVQISPELTMSVGTNVLIPAILLGVLILYLSEGTSAARLAIYGILAISAIVLLGIFLLNINLRLPGGGNVAGESFENLYLSFDLREAITPVLALIAGLYTSAFVYQAVINRWRKVSPGWAVGIALVSSLWVNALIFQALESPEQAMQFDQLGGQLAGLTVSALVIWPMGATYLGKVAKEMPEYAGNQPRRTFELLFGRLGQLESALTRTEATLQRRAAELAALQSIVLELITARDSSSLLQSIVQQASTLLNGSGGSLYITEPDQKRVRCVYSFDTGSEHTGTVLAYGEGIAGKVAQTGRALLIDDYSSWPGRATDLQGGEQFQSAISVPMNRRDEVIGVIVVLSKEGAHQFTEADQKLLSVFANHATIAVENARLLEAERQRAEEAETLRHAGAAVAATLNQSEAIERILVQLGRVLPYDSASVMLLRDGSLEIVGGRGWPDPSVVVGMKFPVPGDNPNTVVIETREPHVLNDAPAAFGEFRKGPHSHIRSWLGVPLIVQKRLVGMLAVDSKRLNYFTEEHARLVSAFADHVAVAIENARLFENEHRRAEELGALRALMAELSAELKLPKLLNAILERAVALLDTTGGELGLYHKERGEIEIVASHGLSKDYVGTVMHSGEGAMGRVIQTGEPVIVQDYAAWEGRSPQYTQESWHAAVAVPMVFRGELIGLVGVVDQDLERQFNQADLELIKLFANQAAIAIENARLYQVTKQAADKRAVLHRASQEMVAASLDLEKIYTAIHQAASQLMPCEAFVISLLDEGRNEVEGVYLVDKNGRTPPQRIPANEGLSGYVIETGESVCSGDYGGVEKLKPAHFGHPDNVRSVLAVPMRSGDKIVGMLSAQSYQAHAYSQGDLELLELLAAHAAIAVDNAHLFNEVQTLAVTDSLTNLANRRALDRALEREVARAERYGHPVSLIIADIDDFKQYNDTYGHLAGDERLKAFAELLIKNVREPDIVARFGGEEFALLLPHCEKTDAYKLAERVRAAAENCAPTPSNGAGLPVSGFTLSLGVATYPQDAHTPMTLLHASDNAELAAKRNGKNRVVAA